MPHLGGPELLIILLIVILLFGIGRISKVGRELGSGIREFRKGLAEGGSDTKSDELSDQSKSS
jgi:sec-independent protein translocase protein TatA